MLSRLFGQFSTSINIDKEKEKISRPCPPRSKPICSGYITVNKSSLGGTEQTPRLLNQWDYLCEWKRISSAWSIRLLVTRKRGESGIQ
jgi:hypothetical protein